MDLDLNQEQRILKQSAGVFLKKEFPKEIVRALDDSEEGYSPELWKKIAEMGWVGLMVPEQYGGSDCSFLDLMVILEEMGYNICPGPFFPTAVLGVLPLMAAANDVQKSRLLPQVCSGEVILTTALTEPSAQFDAASVQLKAVPRGDEYILTGTKLFVPYAHVADHILCVARTKASSDPAEGITVFLVDGDAPGLECSLLKTISREKQCRVVFDDVPVPAANIVGALDRGWPVLSKTLEMAAVAQCADMVGGATAAMDMALEYAQERVQFGRPIGSFQAVQHHFADMWIGIHGARRLTHKAAARISEGLPAAREVAVAKAHVGTVCRKATTVCHEIFGAIGFTMEHDLHLYHRRVMAGDVAFGNADLHLETVAASLGL